MKKSTICSLLFISTLTATGTAHAVKYAGEYSPAWSPDGQWIAYHKNSEKHVWDVVIKNVKTGELQQLTNTPGMEVDASWSPDGEQLVFSVREGNNWDIHLHDRKTGKTTALIEHPGKDTAPQWSPDGKTIAFVSDRNGEQQLYLYSVARQKLKQLTDTGMNINHPSWRDDGKALVFDQFFKNADGKGGISKVFEVEIASREVTKLYHAKGSSMAAKRVGDQLYVTNNANGDWDIVKVDLKSGKETRLTEAGTNEMKATISLATGQIAWSAQNSEGVFEVQVKSL